MQHGHSPRTAWDCAKSYFIVLLAFHCTIHYCRYTPQGGKGKHTLGYSWAFLLPLFDSEQVIQLLCFSFLPRKLGHSSTESEVH